MRLCAMLLALLVCAGCSSDGLVDASGEVKLDGKPLSMGTVSFYPADGKGPSSAAVLKEDGHYTVRAAPGRKRVEILGYKKVGQKRHTEDDPSSPIVDITEQIVPERYNAKSELTCEIVSGPNDLNFDLKTQ